MQLEGSPQVKNKVNSKDVRRKVNESVASFKRILKMEPVSLREE